MDYAPFPYTSHCIRTQREIVVAAALGNFTTHSWTVVRDPASCRLVIVTGAVGVTNTPISVTPERRFPWHHFSVETVPTTSRAADVAGRVNRAAVIMLEIIDERGGRILVDSGPIAGDDIAYDGVYQRVAPAKRFRQAFSDYAAQSVTPIADALFRVA